MVETPQSDYANAPMVPVDVDVEQPQPVENPDGSVDVDLSEGEPPPDMGDGPAHGDNLTGFLRKEELDAIGLECKRLFDEDKQSRAEWEQMTSRALDQLGIKFEDRNRPFPGAFGGHSTLMMEAVVRFQSNCSMEIFPSEAGPTKAKIVGEITPDVQDQADRVVDFMNYTQTEVMTDYRLETEKLLFALGLQGSAFRKVYPDPIRPRPTATFIPAEDFVVPYGASSLESAPRYTEVQRVPRNDLLKMQVKGFYRMVNLGEPLPPITAGDQVRDKKDEVAKELPSGVQQDMYHLLEMHCDYNLPGFEDPDGIALPYVITFERDSATVLGIKRNWDEQDPDKKKLIHYAAYHFIPGFGYYGFGLLHLIGGSQKGSTSILRQLIDAGTLSNLPGGFKTKQARVARDSMPIAPGEWPDVDLVSGKLADAFFPLPYKEPSLVLMQMRQQLEDQGRRLASIVDPDLNMNGQAPVGTTLAILENMLKIISAVQARVHTSLHDEFKILARVIRDLLPEEGEYPYSVHGGNRKIMRQDFDDRIDVLPVSNPNAATMAERVMQYQAATQLSQSAPQIYNMPMLHRSFLRILGIKDTELIIPEKDKIPQLDPITENQKLIDGEPVKAYQDQNHGAHIQAHLNFKHDPNVAKQMSQMQQGQALAAAMDAHIAEHVGMQYRSEVEKALGVPLPMPDQPIPPDVEANMSLAIAAATERVLQAHQAQDAQQQAQQQAQDPVLQMQAKELQLKGAALQQKAQADQAKNQTTLQVAAMRNQTELKRVESQHSAQQNAAQSKQFTDMVDAHERADRLHMDGEKLKADLARLLNDLGQQEQPQGSDPNAG